MTRREDRSAKLGFAARMLRALVADVGASMRVMESAATPWQPAELTAYLHDVVQAAATLEKILPVVDCSASAAQCQSLVADMSANLDRLAFARASAACASFRDEIAERFAN